MSAEKKPAPARATAPRPNESLNQTTPLYDEALASGRPHANRSLFEAEAYGAAMRAGLSAGLLDKEMGEAENAMRAAGLDDLVRDISKTRELFRLITARLAAIARRLAEDTP